jgi:hypothetical protein
MGYQLIETVTVGSSGAASIEFTGIAGTGQDLVCVVSARINDTNSYTFTVNSNSSATYATKILAGNGSSPFTTASTGYGGYATKPAYTANTFSNSSMYFSNYASSQNKSFSTESVIENNATFSLAGIIAGSISDTNPITSLKLLPAASQTYVEHTTASIYLITAD